MIQKINSVSSRNKIQNTNFGKKPASKIIKAGIIASGVAIVASWGGVIGSYVTNKNLKTDIKSKVNAAQFVNINAKADSIAQKTSSFPFLYSKANEFLKEVKKSIKK